MSQLKYKLMSWMQGRYGSDQLNKDLLKLFTGLFVVNLFLRSSLLYTIALALSAVSLLRVFSKKQAKRSSENQKYLALRDNFKKRFLLIRNRIKEYKTHRYRSCPSCKTTLRLSKKIGTVHVKCPVCKNEFDIVIKH